MNINLNTKRYLLFVVALTLLYGVCFVFADFYGMPCSGIRDFLVLAAQWGVVTVASGAMLWLLSSWRWLFAVSFPLLTLLCTVLAYFRLTVKVALTPMIIDLAMVNDLRTDLDVVSWQLIVFCLLSLSVSAWTVWWRWRRVRLRRPWLHALIALMLVVAMNNVGAFAHPIASRIPYNIYYAVTEYFDDHSIAQEHRPVFAGKAMCSDDSLTVVFVLGESLRAQNMQINGYQRATTPLLCREKNVVSLPQVWSEYCFTHQSVPYLLTRADHQHPDRAYTERSLISLLRQAGYHTTWIANQESVPMFIYMMKECDTLIYANGGKSLYVFDRWLDGDMLPHFDRELRRPQQRLFVLLHSIGSHWWYNSHYDRALWSPVIRSRVISRNTHDEMVNSYDNTIAYSDRFWHALINRLRHRRAILIYLSDHAECLGEDGLYTHGSDHPVLHRPGCFVWFSDSYAQRYPQRVEALRLNSGRSFNSSFLFHSLLDAASVKSPYINRKENIFAR